MADTVTTVGMSWLRRLAFAFAMCLGGAVVCQAAEDYQPQFADKPGQPGFNEYIFAVHPLLNPERLFSTYAPLADYLSTHMPGVRFRLEASRNLEDFERKIVAGSVHFILCNQRQLMIAIKHGYKVFGKMADDAEHYGIILLRTDSGIEKISDLKGKKISYPAVNAMAATMMPQYYLHTHGLDVSRDIESVYAGSYEAAILSVYHGLTAAGTTWPVPWRKFQEAHPEIASKLVVKWRTEALPNNGVAVRADVPDEVTAKVADLLFQMREDAAGRKILDAIPVSGFERANAETYASTRDFLRRFSSEIGPVAE